jgi:glycine/D-amino acid oxidase-like deaminating enzyme
MSRTTYDVVVIGGGFFGCSVAIYFARLGKTAVVLERENGLLLRASYNNQARIHGGYHYPRSFRTANRSRQNLEPFIRDYSECAVGTFTKLYGIAGVDSLVSGSHFSRFCHLINAPLKPAAPKYVRLFCASRVSDVFEAEELAFDAVELARITRQRLLESGGEIRLGVEALGVASAPDSRLNVETTDGVLNAKLVFNCTYSALNRLKGMSSRAAGLRHLISEVVLVEPPEPLENLGITLMDGPFFSMMPFPAARLHSFTHVRYTHHYAWKESGDPGLHPYDALGQYHKRTNYPYMIRDAERYLPVIRESRYVRSLFEMKTLLVSSEIDDSRPILFARDEAHPQLISVLGGKIDNVVDMLQYLEQEFPA